MRSLEHVPHALSKYRPSEKRGFAIRSAWKPNQENKAPNLTLNIPKAIPEIWKVQLFAAIGLLIQTTVLIFNAIVVYRFRWLRAGNVVAKYGYPVWAVGTLIMNLGVSLCARVIQNSTIVFTIHVGSLSEDARILRVQEQIIDSNIPGYIIFSGKNDRSVNVSRREWPPSPGDKPNLKLATEQLFLTWLGSGLTLAGFVCQNVGTRELHLSASLVQLGATLTMTVLRAWLRRHAGDPPTPTPIILVEGFEASQIGYSLEKTSFSMLFDRKPVLLIEEAPKGLSSAILQEKFYLTPWKPSSTSEDPREPQNYIFDKITRILDLQAQRFVSSEDSSHTKVASNICDAVNSIIAAVISSGAACQFQWTYHIMMWDHRNGEDELEAIVPFELSTFGEVGKKTVANIISVLWHHHKFIAKYNFPDLYTRILGHCNQEQLERQKEHLKPWFGKLLYWNRNAGGEISIGDQSGDIGDRLGVVLGARYSSLFKER